MDLHPSTFLLLARDRQAEYLREAQRIALAERAARASGQGPGLISRLLAAWGRRIAAARASKPALSEDASR